jgi:hypothetical protein
MLNETGFDFMKLIQHLTRSSSVVVTIGLIFSCSADPDSSKLKNDKRTPRILLVAMGGFASCTTGALHKEWESPVTMPMALQSYNLEQYFEHKSKGDPAAEVDLFLSCFTKLAELRYSTSADQYKKLYINQTLKTTVEFIEKMIPNYDAVFAIGHSYGGWLGMKLLSSPRLSEGSIQSFHSIDPISRTNCRLENPFSWGNCTTAPTDFKPAELDQISSVTQHWMNSWQDQTFVLHSSEIEQANQNIYYETTHTRINDLPDVWDYFKEDITGYLAAR